MNPDKWESTRGALIIVIVVWLAIVWLVSALDQPPPVEDQLRTISGAVVVRDTRTFEQCAYDEYSVWRDGSCHDEDTRPWRP